MLMGRPSERRRLEGIVGTGWGGQEGKGPSVRRDKPPVSAGGKRGTNKKTLRGLRLGS